ncbi:alcohol dehydrogenase [Chloropicon primus]|uniref:Alcohol dehydrogenase 4 n=2 Tax=Chloropicon primus TaxID=1764295 RepID=A0A5B8MYW2_9CHLO|nr:alcohol dehydrogenase [Chloropicon primus]|eukprot:QDZ24842.1 alcohol dehydrogenase [Chloropicon primus]
MATTTMATMRATRARHRHAVVASASEEKQRSGNQKQKHRVVLKAPARSVKAQQLKPRNLSEDSTQTAHGLGYHHPRSETGYYFYMPTMSLFGVNALGEAVVNMKGRGLDKVLVVTDKVLNEIGAVKRLTDLLDDHEIEYFIFDDITPNPTASQVREGVKRLHEFGSSAVVSFGGGSPHDCAKAIALVATNGGDIKDYEGVDKSEKPMLPLVAINTTAGTASEMTRFCIITDEERKVKMAIVDWHTTPDIAVDDPSLMLGMPKGLTAATGMDALTHAIEAYVSTISSPITDACALHAIKLISRYLRTAVEHGDDLQARDMMSYAEFLAGMAFNSASLGYVHAMAHQLGGFYNLPHGVCNAVLLPVVQERNAKHAPELFIDLGRALGIEGLGDDDPERAQAMVIASIKGLSKSVGIPENLESLGVKREDFDVLAENAMKDACGATNPFQPTKQEVIDMFEQAFTQTLPCPWRSSFLRFAMAGTATPGEGEGGMSLAVVETEEEREARHQAYLKRVRDAEELEVKLRKIQEDVPTKICNTTGSTAGSGSGSFHTYRTQKRRDQIRQQALEQELKRDREQAEFDARKDELNRIDESRTAKNRAKRQKLKEKKLAKRKSKGGGGAPQQGEPAPPPLARGGQGTDAEKGEDGKIGAAAKHVFSQPRQ